MHHYLWQLSDEDESQYCELGEDSTDPNHSITYANKTDAGDEHCPDCEASSEARPLARQIAKEQERLEMEAAEQVAREWVTEQEEEAAEQERHRQEGEQRGQAAEEYYRTGRWPGVNMKSGFQDKKDHNSWRER